MYKVRIPADSLQDRRSQQKNESPFMRESPSGPMSFNKLFPTKLVVNRFRPGSIAMRSLPQNVSRGSSRVAIKLQSKSYIKPRAKTLATTTVSQQVDANHTITAVNSFIAPLISCGNSIEDKICLRCHQTGIFSRTTPFCKICVEQMKVHNTKTCTDCLNDKSLAEFATSSKALFGLQQKCRKCISKIDALRSAGKRLKNCNKCLVAQNAAQFKPRELKFCITCVPKMISDSKKVCSSCNEYLPVDLFYKSERKHFMGCEAACKKCQIAKMTIRFNSLRGRLEKMCKHAREAARRREIIDKASPEKDHRTRYQFDITAEDLFELYISQRQRCYYSGMMLNYQSFTDWFISLERLDPEKGYVKDNVVLCALEFNSQNQFTPEIFNNWMTICNMPSTLSDNGVMNTELSKAEIRGLKVFLANINQRHLNKKDGDKNYIANVTFDSLAKQWILQKRRCAYSQIPLKLIAHQHEELYAASIERICTKKGYIDGNVCFIWKFLNSSDMSAMREEVQQGSSGWNVQKVQQVLTHYNTTN